jgi:hypothetical protein
LGQKLIVGKLLRSPSILIPIGTALAVGSVVVATLAAGSFIDAQPENGTLAGNATVVTDASASGGKAIQFGGSTTACLAGPKNAPGTTDPWGGCWPGPNNTGVPAGTALTNVPQQATSGTGWAWNAADSAVYVTQCGVTLSGLNINGSLFIRQGNGTASASTPCVTLAKSKINGYVDTTDACLTTRCGPLVMTDDEVDTSQGATWQVNGATINVDRANVLYDNFYEWRVNNHGGNGPDHCDGNCEIHDSWEHGLIVEYFYHMNAIGSNGTGAGNRLTVDHDYLACGDQAGTLPGVTNQAGCTSDLAMLNDFAQVTLTAEHNYFAPAQTTGPYANYQPGACLYPGQGQNKPYPTINDYIANNVFAKGPTGKCGIYFPIYDWGNGAVSANGTDSGNVWGPGNVWDDGTLVPVPGG